MNTSSPFDLIPMPAGVVVALLSLDEAVRDLKRALPSDDASTLDYRFRQFRNLITDAYDVAEHPRPVSERISALGVVRATR